MKRLFGLWIDRKKMSKCLLVAALSRLAVWALGDVSRNVSLHSFPVESFGDSVVGARLSHVTTCHFIMEGLKRFQSVGFRQAQTGVGHPVLYTQMMQKAIFEKEIFE